MLDDRRVTFSSVLRRARSTRSATGPPESSLRGTRVAFGSVALFAGQLDDVPRHVDVRHPVVEQADVVFAGLGALDDDVGHDVRNVLGW